MPTGPTTRVFEQLRRAVLRDGEAGDGELLGQFIERRDEAALAALVQRHGPMVWGVCRRLLSHHDAEDAFQAAFLVLVRKASSVSPRGMVGNWLYGVSHQTALQARRSAVRRRARETTVNRMPDPETLSLDPWAEVQPLLDQELSRLPENYRAVVVLCDLEGRTRKEAARQLRVPEGTVAGRLARARTMLAKRLAQRGVTLAGGALAAVLAQHAASAVVPAAVVSNTIGAATLVAAGQVAMAGVISVEVATLTEGVLKAMLISKLKALVAIVLVLGFLTTAATVLTYPMAAAEGDKPTHVKERLTASPEVKKEVGMSTLTVTIKPKVNQVRINTPFDVDLRVVNSSKSTQSFQVMDGSWDEHWKSNNDRVSWVGWDCTKNFPVTVKLEPGERYEKTLPMLLPTGKPLEKLSFKMGFTPIDSKETFWSNEVSVQVDPVSGLSVTIWPKVNRVRINEPFDVDLRVVNSSKSTQSFQVMAGSWHEHWKSNNEQVSRRPQGGSANGPVTVKLKPGEWYEKTLPVQLTAGKPEEKVPFKMGFTPIDSKQPFWSDEVIVQVEPQKDDKLPPGIEAQLKWGEPVNGLRAAMAIRLAPGRAKTDKPDLYMALQNVSKEPIRLSDADVPADVNLRMLRVRKDGRILYGLGAREPGLGERLLKPREVTYLPMFDPDTKLDVPTKNGDTIGSDHAGEALKDARMTFTGEFTIEKAPAKAWKGKLVTGESGGAAAEFPAAEKPASKPDEVHPTQDEMRLLAAAKAFCVAMRNNHGDKNANALREFIDPRYLEKNKLKDVDLAIPMLPVGSIFDLQIAEDGLTIYCVVGTGGTTKDPIKEVLVLKMSDFEGKGGTRYLAPPKAPDPKTGSFAPWILRAKL